MNENSPNQQAQQNASGKRFNVVPLWQYTTDCEGIQHISLTPNGQELAVSQWDGTIQILSSRTGRVSYSVPFIDKDAVVTCSKFHPYERLLICTGTTGNVLICQYQKGNYVWSNKEEENSVYACAFSSEGDMFMTGGKDAIIRLYDTKTGKIIRTYSKSDESPESHSARVYCVINDYNNNHIFISGGWDQKVIIWDTRSAEGVSHVSGPNICGDSIDIHKDTILTGSWRPTNQLELWDIRTCANIKQNNFGKNDLCHLYGAKFAQTEGFIVAGGSDSSSIKTFDDNLEQKERLGYFEGAVTAVAASADGMNVFASSQNGSCFAFSKETLQ